MRFYVGTYTVRGSKGIYVLDLDPATGAIRQIGAVGGVPNPSFLALEPKGTRLYAVSELHDTPGKSGGGVAAFVLPSPNALPVLMNTQPSRGADPCHISVDPSGRSVLVANYTSGTLAAFPIGSDGSIQPASTVIQDPDSSHVNPARQDGPHAHCIVTDPAGRYAIAADLGCDRLFVFRLDPKSATLTPNDPPAVVSHPGTGPRHIAFAPDGRHVYVVHELTAEVVTYAYDSRHGRLTELQSIPSLPAGWTGQNTAAEIAVHPSGRFLYTSNRGNDGIAVFAIDKKSGILRSLGSVSSRGKTPRGFAIDPSGAYLVVGNQDTDNLTVLHIDQNSGALTPAGPDLAVPSPVSVLFA